LASFLYNEEIMKFIDIAQVHVNAGNGGPGAVSFRHEKYAPKGGPDGGNGGNGGNVILQATNRLQTLIDLKMKNSYKSENGQPGRPKKQFGAHGKDIVIPVPCGTIVYDSTNSMLADLVENEATFVVCHGGKGGRGNAVFSTATNRTPRHAQTGLPGEEASIKLELKLIADVGFIGLPNSGKSSLLKALTLANPKVAAYPFSTLTPNLGVLKYIDREVVIADIPGLVEGASKGVGLGADFLRHIDRTKILFQLVDGSSQNPKECWEHFQIIQNELRTSDFNIACKKLVVVLTKIDIIDSDSLKKIELLFSKKGFSVLSLSSFSLIGTDELVDKINHLLF